MTQTVPNVCVRCEMKFSQWVDYHDHITVNTCYKKIKPTKTTDRTHDQIVKDWEAKNQKGIIS